MSKVPLYRGFVDAEVEVVARLLLHVRALLDRVQLLRLFCDMQTGMIESLPSIYSTDLYQGVIGVSAHLFDRQHATPGCQRLLREGWGG